MTDYDEDQLDELDSGELGSILEPTSSSLVHWIQEQFIGDDRYEVSEIEEPGPLEGESVRLNCVYDQASNLFVSVFEDDAIIRIGLATTSEEISEKIENASEEHGASLTEFFQDLMAADDELEYEVQHFHDDQFYFCSEMQFQCNEDLASNDLRDLTVFYLDGYTNAMLELLEPSS
jgi:hypothetical protein